MQPHDRASRPLSPDETRVRQWIRQEYGVLSRVAKEFGVSVAFVNRIAYNRSEPSKDYRVEKRLISLGCPLIQRVSKS